MKSIGNASNNYILANTNVEALHTYMSHKHGFQILKSLISLVKTLLQTSYLWLYHCCTMLYILPVTHNYFAHGSNIHTCFCKEERVPSPPGESTHVWLSAGDLEQREMRLKLTPNSSCFWSLQSCHWHAVTQLHFKLKPFKWLILFV